ncbi:MAG TPA: hypothetical protein VFR34_08050, partial [Paracoccaceae bacterium]|nr:hypothetical protein [Paracoccaceae bacterium]
MRAALWIGTAIAGLGTAAAAFVFLPELLHLAESAKAKLPAEAAAPATPRVVMVTPVSLRPDGFEHRLPGIVAAHTETDLAFRVGGKLLARAVS